MSNKSLNKCLESLQNFLLKLEIILHNATCCDIKGWVDTNDMNQTSRLRLSF